MSFVGAGYAAPSNMDGIPLLLSKTLSDKGKNGAKYVLVLNEYDNNSGHYYADIWAQDDKGELKHAKHLKDVDASKILGAGAALAVGKEALSSLKQERKTIARDLENLNHAKEKQKSAKSKIAKKVSAKKVDRAEDKLAKDIKKTKAKIESKKDDLKLSKAEAKKLLDKAKADYKKTGEAITKARTEKTKQIARAAHARSGKALIEAQNAIK